MLDINECKRFLKEGKLLIIKCFYHLMNIIYNKDDDHLSIVNEIEDIKNNSEI